MLFVTCPMSRAVWPIASDSMARAATRGPKMPRVRIGSRMTATNENNSLNRMLRYLGTGVSSVPAPIVRAKDGVRKACRGAGRAGIVARSRVEPVLRASP